MTPIVAGPYSPGPFMLADIVERQKEIAGRPEGQAFLEDNLANTRRVLVAAGAQLGLTPEESLSQLGWEKIQLFATNLYYARDGRGQLVLGKIDAETFGRWLYRELPLRISTHPMVMAPTLDRDAVRRALMNPFAETNRQGNEAVAGLITRLVDQQALIDDPERLRRNPSLVQYWIYLLLATNLVDLQHSFFLEDLSKEKGATEEERLTNYLLRQAIVPFAWREWNTKDMARYVDDILLAEPRAGRDHVLEVDFGDNNAQLAATLKVAEIKLSMNPKLRIVLVLKGDNGVMNDASVEDAEALLDWSRTSAPGLYRRLLEYRAEGRFEILRGPCSHGTPLHLLSPQVAGQIQLADCVWSEGEANTWTLNGLLARNLVLLWRLKWDMSTRHVVGLDPDFLGDFIKGDKENRPRPPAFMLFRNTEDRYYTNVFGRQGVPPRLTIEDAWARPHRVTLSVLPGKRLEWTPPTGGPTLELFFDRKGRLVNPEPAGWMALRGRSIQEGSVGDFTRDKVIRKGGILTKKQAGDEGYLREIIGSGIYFFPTATIQRLTAEEPPQPMRVWRVAADYVIRDLDGRREKGYRGPVTVEISYWEPSDAGKESAIDQALAVVSDVPAAALDPVDRTTVESILTTLESA